MARCESHYCWKCTGSSFWVLSIFLLLLTREVSLDNDYQYIAKDILEEANDYLIVRQYQAESERLLKTF